jgi:endonuclease-3
MDISLKSMRLASISGCSDVPGGCATYFLDFHAHLMSALKRSLASPTTSPRLTARVSHHNAAVTLFQLSSHEDDVEHSPRRSKRVKTRNNADTEGQLAIDNLSHNVLSVKSWKTDDDATASGSALPSTSRPRDVQASPKKFKAIPQSLATPHPPPSTWKETYDTIKVMRSRFVAPVDTMGCDRAQFKETDPKVIDFFLIYSRLHSESTLIILEAPICDTCLSHAVFTNQRSSR